MSINTRLARHFMVYLGKAGSKEAMSETAAASFQSGEKGANDRFHEIKKICEEHSGIFITLIGIILGVFWESDSSSSLCLLLSDGSSP